MLTYIRKNHLDPEIYEIVSMDGETVHWHGTEDNLSCLLGNDEWCSDDTVALGKLFARLVKTPTMETSYSD